MRETGPSSVMKVEHDYPVPKLAPGGVLVKNKYSGINFIDTYHRSGLYKRELPFIGGQEGGGFVAAVTPEAEAQGVKVGDRVAYSLCLPDLRGVHRRPGQQGRHRPRGGPPRRGRLLRRAGHDRALPHP